MKLLVVIDMQKDFIDGSLGTPEAQAIVPNVIKKIKEFSGDMIYATQDTHYDTGEKAYEKTLEGLKLPVRHCIEGTDGWKIPKEIFDVLVEKQAVGFIKNTFGCVNIAPSIDANDLETIEICGLCTDICVVSNTLLLRAAFPNTPIEVDASCCAGTTPENHQKALDVMKCCQIDIVNEI